jgi:ABC-type transport system involved in multi-copper enzyme maturation permease subunit
MNARVEHKAGFRLWDGKLLQPSTRFLVLAWSEVRRLLRPKLTRLLLYIAFIPFIVVVMVRIGTSIATGAAGVKLPIDPDILGKLLTAQVQFLAIMAAAAGSGSIASDRQCNALPLYLSRPISPMGYLAGKLAGLAAILAAIYLAPALVYALFEHLTEADPALLPALARLAAVLVAAGLPVAVFALAILFFSSLGTRPRYVGIAWIALFFLSKALATALYEALSFPTWTRYVSLADLCDMHTAFCLHGAEGPWATLILITLGSAAGLGLSLRVRRSLAGAISS